MRNQTFFALITLSTGCATITRGTNEGFGIQTTPPGADARLSNGLSCVTPCSVKVKRRGDFVVTIARDGYETVNASVTSSVDGGGAAGMAGNVILGGIIGAGVDAGTGAMHSHKPNPLVVTLMPLSLEKMEAKKEEVAAPEVGTNSVLKNKEVGQ
jgi:hypothetical protein